MKIQGKINFQPAPRNEGIIGIQSVIFAFCVCFVCLVCPELYASTPEDSNVGNYICKIANNFTGNAGRGIATIGISVIGTLALLGRITWTQALVVGVGCAVLFGAPALIRELGANGACP